MRLRRPEPTYVSSRGDNEGALEGEFAPTDTSGNLVAGSAAGNHHRGGHDEAAAVGERFDGPLVRSVAATVAPTSSVGPASSWWRRDIPGESGKRGGRKEGSRKNE